jgi:hypothetical protein
MIRPLEISWEHRPGLTEIPVITSDTKKTFCELLKELKPAFEHEYIILKFSSKEVPGETGQESKVILNRRSLEELLTEVAGEQRQCEGRRCEMGKPLTFPFVLKGDIQYLSVPDLIIRKIFLRAVGII